MCVHQILATIATSNFTFFGILHKNWATCPQACLLTAFFNHLCLKDCLEKSWRRHAACNNTIKMKQIIVKRLFFFKKLIFKDFTKETTHWLQILHEYYLSVQRNDGTFGAKDEVVMSVDDDIRVMRRWVWPGRGGDMGQQITITSHIRIRACKIQKRLGTMEPVVESGCLTGFAQL